MLPNQLPANDRRFISPDASVDGFDRDYADDAFEFATKHTDTAWGSLSATYQRTIDPIQLADWLKQRSQDEKHSPSSASRQDPAALQSLYREIKNNFEIRVLEIYPGERDDDLYGALRHCSIEFAYRQSNVPRGKNLGTQHGLDLEDGTVPVWYTALSYTWGPNVFDCQFNCGGHTKHITKSLDTALRHFRRLDKSVVMWIDQICINQDDLDEKVGQIKLMSRIYTHAFNTVLWLGESTQNTRQAVELLGSFKNFFLALPSASDLGELGLPSVGTEPWEGLWDILSRSWFTRLWTVQEAVLSRYRWIMCGEYLVDWDDLTSFTCRLEESDIQPILINMHAGKDQDTRFFRRYHASWLLQELSSRHMSEHGSKFDLLTTVRHTLSWDPRDKIYGVLGIMSSQEAAQIKVSYDPDYTIGEVYEQVTAIDLEDEPVRIARVLACVDHDPETTHQSLPSWVPDWSQQRETTSIAFNVTEAHVYHASGKVIPGIPPNITYTYQKDTRQIRVRARKLGVIAQFSDVFLEQPLPDGPLQIKGDSAIQKLVSTVRGLSPNPYGDDLFGTLWQTMVAARHDQGSVSGARAEFEELFSLIFDEATGGSPSQPSLPGQTYTARQHRPAGRGKLELSNLLTRKPYETYRLARTVVGAAIKNRRVAVLDNGYLALVPRYVRKGDWVCIFEGVFFRVPMVVRPKESHKFTFLGESYVHGAMGGEFSERDDIPWEEIALV